MKGLAAGGVNQVRKNGGGGTKQVEEFLPESCDNPEIDLWGNSFRVSVRILNEYWGYF